MKKKNCRPCGSIMVNFNYPTDALEGMEEEHRTPLGMGLGLVGLCEWPSRHYGIT